MQLCMIYSVLFQSTLPRGSDCVARVIIVAIGNFNPRSLAGATAFRKRRILAQTNFNPRSLAGATLSLTAYLMRGLVFQSTLPRGSDKMFCHCIVWTGNFNPRSLAGATKYGDVDKIPIKISIHAPSRERLNSCYKLWYNNINFNPRSLAGATKFSSSG